MSLNDAEFSSVEVQAINHKGHGLVALEKLDSDGSTPLVTVPHDLVLNAEAVENYAKADRNFKALLDACGHTVSLVALSVSFRLWLREHIWIV